MRLRKVILNIQSCTLRTAFCNFYLVFSSQLFVFFFTLISLFQIHVHVALSSSFESVFRYHNYLNLIHPKPHTLPHKHTHIHSNTPSLNLCTTLVVCYINKYKYMYYCLPHAPQTLTNRTVIINLYFHKTFWIPKANTRNQTKGIKKNRYQNEFMKLT